MMLSDFTPAPAELQPIKFTGPNWIGLYTLVRKEVGRFLNVYSQTIIAPVVTTLMFFAVFSLALGGTTPGDLPVSYLEFLAPGLLMMTMVQNAFANTSSSIVIAKVQGNIVDVLMPPLSPLEIWLGYILGGLLRGLLIGLVAGIFLALFVHISVKFFWVAVLYAVLGNLMLSSLGLAAGIWSEKFDHIAAVTNFIVTPLTFLSGTFYSIQRLPEVWQIAAHFDPFFYMIDGFRYAFTGHADGNLIAGAITLIVFNAALAALTMGMLRSGYKIKS